MNRVFESGMMMSMRNGRVLRLIGVLGLALLLAACAGNRSYREGQALWAEGQGEAALAKLEEAVRLEPRNAEFRIALASSRAALINRHLLQAERAFAEGRLSDAEKAYRLVQGLDADNEMARQGLARVIRDRQHRQVVVEAQQLLEAGKPADLDAALEKLRPVLAEQPQQKEVRALKLRIDDARARQVRPEARLSEAFRKPISLEFRDAPLRSVLEVVSKVAAINFFYDKDIRPDLKVTIYAKDTTVEDAVRLILVTNQLEQKVLNANSVLIYPATPQKLKEYQSLSVRSFYLKNADVKAVSSTLKTIVKAKDLVIDERLGIIFMRDTPEALRMAERIVALQDLADPEVMLEVEILEVKRSRLLELGIQWPSQLSLSPLAKEGSVLTLEALKNIGASTTQATIGSLNFNARRETQDTNILANPRIRVRNKDKAKIQIGDRVPVITTTSTSTGFVSESVNYVDVGLKLEVEPSIYLDDEVAIKVGLEVSNLVREVTSKSGTLSYQIGTRGANTVLRLRDGETQILAGLISDEDRNTANKVPALGELPVAGRLFGSHKDDTVRSEILLSITPRIVRSLQRPDLLSAEFDSGTELSIGSQALQLSGDAPEKAAKSPPEKAPATPAAAAPAAPAAPAEPVAAVSGAVALSWQVPQQVRAGEQFSAVLRLDSQAALKGMPLLLAYDPQILQVAGVQEGSFFRQGRGEVSFSQRVDPAQGKVFIALVRRGDAGVNGSADLVNLSFKAVKPGNARLQVLSATPEPLLASPMKLPVEASVRVAP